MSCWTLDPEKWRYCLEIKKDWNNYLMLTTLTILVGMNMQLLFFSHPHLMIKRGHKIVGKRGCIWEDWQEERKGNSQRTDKMYFYKLCHIFKNKALRAKKEVLGYFSLCSHSQDKCRRVLQRGGVKWLWWRQRLQGARSSAPSPSLWWSFKH